MTRRLIPLAGKPAAPAVTASAAPAVTTSAAPAVTADTIDVLARTLWGEARAEPVRAIEAVAAVVINRVRLAQARGGHWWGDSVQTVCLKPFQFACWSKDGTGRADPRRVTVEDPVFATCLRTARRAAAGLLPDPTGGATHYHRAGVHPVWAAGRSPSAEIGGLVFYPMVE